MSIVDLWKLASDVVTPSDLFTSLFSVFDKAGYRVSSGPDTGQYQYLSYIRKINGSGMALAGVEDTAVFSIVVANRLGPLDNVTPITLCAYLVSIEGVEAIDAFEQLGRTLNVLRAPEAIVAPLLTSGDKMKQLVARRLDDGYIIVGRTMALGDEAFTAALGRLRSAIHRPASDSAKLQTLMDIDDMAFRTRGELLGDLSGIVPAYGFYLRSDLVTIFPDLRVEVLADDSALRSAGEDPPAGAPLLRHDIVTDGVMMAFMDRVPGSSQFASLVLTQPSHQQRFAVARGLDTTEVKVDIRRHYTVDQTTREKDKDRHDALEQVIYHPKGDGSSDNIFIWDSQPGEGLNDLRMLRLPRFADVQLKVLQDKMGSYDDGVPYFDGDATTSALCGMQLNDPIYNLTIDLQAHAPTSSSLTSLGRPGGGLVSRDIAAAEREGDGRTPSAPAQGKTDDEDVEKATFQRHENYSPTQTAISSHLTPHVRALPACTEAALDTPEVIVSRGTTSASVQDDSDLQPQGSEPASSPRYLVRVGSNEIGSGDHITLKISNIAQDLIFSVVLRQSEVNQYLLMEVAIQIELGNSAYGPRPFLMRNYAGPETHMLINLRFNVLPTNVVDGNGRNLLRLRFLPRAAKGWVNVTAVRELSFLLGLASINEPSKRDQEFRVQSWADHCRNPDQPMGTVNTRRIT
ncbi:hypothetical protein HRG_006221 [Hirsutella rhossiliensis]|uniref:Uncharacterized protein n=1 Tax=Hirsutella rhossiliensis TaxID=111463 RepID=A0A9P8SK37_9HYPO|nr:uncharacterized protein HRG_06221 [Hirsutella rhossiliensis]KAH0963711.1 hypothetical protein HRG_06221 [Hirsutella rhossiliensis]